MVNYQIDEMTKNDWDQIKEIYRQGIDTGNATFEFKIPSWEEWDVKHIKSFRLVVRYEDIILGLAALSTVSNRTVYRGVAEVSVYIRNNYQRQGIGFCLLNHLIKLTEKNNSYWTLQAGIFKENIASIRLHEKCGFRKIGIRKKIGKMKNGKWRDVVLMERRSKVVGV